MTVVPAVLPLSAAMREGSAAAHGEAESSPFLSGLAAGRVDAAGYRDYLARLLPVYDALEEADAALAGDRWASAVADPGLHRADALRADLAHWRRVAGAPSRLPVSTASRVYAERIRASVSWGGLFVAHHYVRYLGDLSGGRLLDRLLRGSLAADGVGLRFYDFPAIPRPVPFKRAYRSRLDALPGHPDDVGRVVAEVRAAFGLNAALLAELAPAV